MSGCAGTGGDALAEAGLAGGLLTIDLDAVAANWRLVRDRAAPAATAAVVKADAYGLGVAAVGGAANSAGAEVGGDAKVGMEEAGYALQKTAGSR